MIVYCKDEIHSSIKGCFPDIHAVYSTIPRDVRLHMERVSEYADIFFKYILSNNPEIVKEFGDEFKRNSKQLFKLHDIGRAYVPVKVLNKAGGLTDEEFKMVKQHTVLAKRAIESMYIKPFSEGLMNIFSDIAVYHHERWDGKGYPEGICKDNIPLGARICGIADAFDGMVSWKAYRKSFSVEKALSIINEEAGKQFQPELAVMFCDCAKHIDVIDYK